MRHSSSRACGFRCALRLLLRSGSFRQHLAARLAIPLLVGLGLDLPLDQQLREFATLRLALERHEQCPSLLVLFRLGAIGEVRVTQSRPDRHHRPMLHILHPGQLAQSLHDGVVVHDDDSLVIADLR